MSLREQQLRRERVEFENQFNRERRRDEDHQQYKLYVKQMTSEQLDPLSFDEWQNFMPADEPSPVLRAAIASANSNVRRNVLLMSEMAAKQPLDDETLLQYGFDLEDRILIESELSPFAIKLALKAFVKKEPRWDTSLHWDAVREFMIRNKLNPTPENFSRAFCLLWNLAVIGPKPEEPQPEPQPNPESLNAHGVNLRIERDPEMEKRLAWRGYTTEIVATDPRNGRTWTQYQLDHEADSETYRRLVFGEFVRPKVTDVIQA